MLKPSVTRSSVPKRADYKKYRSELRLDFWFSCAYCSITESEARGIAFQIDHYEPDSTKLPNVNDYDNLMYACDVCNRRKLDLRPSDPARAAGYRFFRPDRDVESEHFELDNNRISWKTKPGEFTVEGLDLNRNSLQKLRKDREEIFVNVEAILAGFRYLDGKRLDEVEPELRLRFRRMLQDVKKHRAQLRDVLRDFARSELLDEDPEAGQRGVERQKYLDDLKALYPGKWRGRDF